jgi:Uma2 family endonuclease
MSTAVPLPPVSLEEFLARPEREDGQREELIDGEVVVSPNVKADHTEVVRRLSQELLQPLARQGFVILTDFACLLEQRSLPNPDVGVVRKETWDAALRCDWLREAPSLAIAVASPGNRKLQRKAALYLDHGAEQVWIVYPRRRTVTVHTVEETSEARLDESVEFQGCTVAVADLFQGLSS